MPRGGSTARESSEARVDLPEPVRPTRAQVWPAGTSEVDVAQGERAGAVAEVEVRGTPRRAARRAAAGRPSARRARPACARSRRTAPKPSCRSGRWRASMSTPPTNIVVTRNSVTSRAVDRSPARTRATPTTPTAASAPWSSPPLRRVIRTSTASTASRVRWTTAARWALRRSTWAWPRRGAQVVAGGDALLGRRRRGRSRPPPRRPCAAAICGSRRRTTSEGGDRGQREEEDRRPPGEARDHPQRAGGEEGARGLPHAPAHQLADLPGVVVDAVEHLADRLLGELGQRLGHGGVEQVGAQLALGAVADRRPDRLGDGVDDRTAHDAQRQQRPGASTWRRRRAGRRPPSPGTPRPRRGATSRSRGRSADGGPGASRRARDRPAARPRTRSPVRAGREVSVMVTVPTG